MPMPLEGIRVLDWTVWQLGPVGTYLLGDLGCEVIRLESLEGDPARNFEAAVGAPCSLYGEAEKNYYFPFLNRNKKSITLDLKKPESKEVVRRLVAKSDVFVSNMRRPVAPRLSMDYETLREYNPRLIYAQASGFGAKGPDKDRPGFDPMGLARCGIMFTAGEPDDPPVTIMGGIADNMGGIFLAFAVQTALIARERFGIGQKVEVSHFGAMLTMMSAIVASGLILGRNWDRHSRKKAPNPLWNFYCCADGKWLQFSIIFGDKVWPDFCKVLGIQHLQNDPRFADGPSRKQHSEELIRVLDERFATRTRDEWMKLLDEGGDFIYTFVNDIPDLRYDEQAVLNNYIVDFTDRDLGPVKFPGLPVDLSETPGSIRTSAPRLGEHNDEIYSQLCGFSAKEIAEFRAKKVI
ncbi:MAG: CoA transferase [Dehalococcoidia bacterium]|nr:CoA transferase [Dehalococcoidia bacterium]